MHVLSEIFALICFITAVDSVIIAKLNFKHGVIIAVLSLIFIALATISEKVEKNCTVQIIKNRKSNIIDSKAA